MKLALIIVILNFSYGLSLISVTGFFGRLFSKSNSTTNTKTTNNINNSTEFEGEWEEHPDEYGNSHKVNIDELELAYANITRDCLVEFFLFTRLNPKNGQIIGINNTESLLRSNFNRNHPTRFITHGWMNNYNSSVNVLIRDAYLNYGNFNVIVVDWRDAARYKWYYFSARKVEQVATRLAEFIDFLYDNIGLTLSNVSLIGHSLGAHASGIAGKKLKNGQINTIIGLDPARPWFSKQRSDKRLAATDAEYVEPIHTDTNYFGFREPLGLASFYPNWGEGQPLCKIDIGGCSHGRSYEYFAESITLRDTHFLVVKCQSYYYLLKKSCNALRFGLKMGGEPSNHGRARGVYYVDVDGQFDELNEIFV